MNSLLSQTLLFEDFKFSILNFNAAKDDTSNPLALSADESDRQSPRLSNFEPLKPNLNAAINESYDPLPLSSQYDLI